MAPPSSEVDLGLASGWLEWAIFFLGMSLVVLVRWTLRRRAPTKPPAP